MTPSIIIYLIKWAVCLTLLYSLFGFFLRHETLHRFNRLVLLLILVASMVLPLCSFETAHPVWTSQGMQRVEAAVHEGLDESAKDDVNTLLPFSEATTSNNFPWLRLCVYIYIIGVIATFAIYVYSLAGILLLIYGGRRVTMDYVPSHVHLIVSEQAKVPCSWMSWVLIHPRDVQRPIVLHELSHIRHGHSWDMLFCEFTARMLWFLPFAWMIRQDMSDVHEYEADHDVLLSGINDDEYQRLLITKAAYPRLRPVVNAFTQSQVKKRFTMMCRRPSRRFVAIKSLYLLPCVAFAVTAFARPSLVEKVQREVEAEAERAPLLSPTTLIESLPLISSTESSEAVEPEKPTTINEVKVEENITNDKAVAETTTQIEEEHPSDILPKSFSSKLIGTWLKVGMQSNGRTVLQKKTIDKNGMFYVMCFHGHEGMHTIVSGRWELLDENHYIEHLDYIVTDLSSEGKDNVITYTLSEDATQLYLSYTMPGNGEQGSECWFRTE